MPFPCRNVLSSRASQRCSPSASSPIPFSGRALANSMLQARAGQCRSLVATLAGRALFAEPELRNAVPWSRAGWGCSLLATRHPSSLSPSSLGDSLRKLLKYSMNGIFYLVPTPTPPRIIFAIHRRNWSLISNLVFGSLPSIATTNPLVVHPMERKIAILLIEERRDLDHSGPPRVAVGSGQREADVLEGPRPRGHQSQAAR